MPVEADEDPSSSSSSTSATANDNETNGDHTSNHVYVMDDDYAWVPARVLETDGATTAKVAVPQYEDEQAIASDGGRTAVATIEKTIQLADYPNAALPLQNVDAEGRLQLVWDMVDLPFLHEAAILYNLKQRHQAGQPYTRTGDIVIAVNPYQWFHDLYAENVRAHYAHRLVWQRQRPGDSNADPRATLEPHVYEASSLAYRGLAVDGDDQSILVSGESGAGKTETVKILLSDLASVQRGQQPTSLRDDTSTSVDDPEHVVEQSQQPQVLVQHESPIVQRVLDSNPLLEAFGNAQTIRNDNSSRFGKYIQLQFERENARQAACKGKAVPSCILAGSTCEVYLLEKSRVVSHTVDEERTYHIFYQLLAAPNDIKTSIWSGLDETDNDSFAYVGATDTDTIEGLTDAERFQQTVDSLALVGVKEEKLRTLLRTICTVMQLGNLTFESEDDLLNTSAVSAASTEGGDEDSTAGAFPTGATGITSKDGSYISSEDELAALAELMGIPVPDLTAALTIRTMRARGEEFKVPLNKAQAKDSCDAFAKEIYAKTFLWLVRAINAATSADRNYEKSDPNSSLGVIGLLDIFGFESFETNRFEQLCINYANEKLQQKFTQDIFQSVQAEYEYEGIELAEIRYDDNTDVLDLVEGRMGLLAFLNEECVRPGGSDKAFVSKVHAINKDSPIFFREKAFEDVEFGIRHYAGRVVYDATYFVTKNTDLLPTDLQECATKSTNDIIAKELENERMMDEDPSKAKKKKRGKKEKHGHSPVARRSSKSNIVAGTVWTKFRNQLTSLMANLSSTRTRYIRCIKPNEDKEPLVMEHQSTVEQLRCAGVVAAVTISRSAFPNRLEHGVILERFTPLWRTSDYDAAVKEAEAATVSEQEQLSHIVAPLLTSALKKLETTRAEDGATVKAFVVGKTRTYFRAGALEHLESERLKGLGFWAVKIQCLARKYRSRSRYVQMRTAAIHWESLVRRSQARRRFVQLRTACILLQCWQRCIKAGETLVNLNRNHKATMIQARWRGSVEHVSFKESRRASIALQKIVRGMIQRPKFRVALHERREEAKLENQVMALQKKLEEAEAKRMQAEQEAEEKAKRLAEEYSQRDSSVEDEKKETTVTTPVTPEAPQLSEQQQTLMDESGKMLEYLRKEVFKLRSQNAQMRTDFDLLKDNNQRLMDANASAGASFAALNQHAKQLTRSNEKMAIELNHGKQSIQKLNITQVELKEELKMKQATYVAEVHSRLQYQKALTKIVDMLQDRCRDTRLVEDVLSVADACEAEYMQGPTGIDTKPRSLFSSPAGSGKSGSGTPGGDSGLMSSIRSFWS